MKKVKICGLSRECDIEAVNDIKPDNCGFVINFPKSKRNVTIEQLKKLSGMLSDDIEPVGVFVDRPVDEIAELLNSGVIRVAQLHGSEDEEYIANLRKLTDKTIWQAFQIRSQEDVLRASNSSADFVLLDAGQGVGKTFDWSLLADFARPFGLAGGLNFENLSTAMETDAVLLDVSGGVETDGVKDSDKIKKFVRMIRYE